MNILTIIIIVVVLLLIASLYALYREWKVNV